MRQSHRDLAQPRHFASMFGAFKHYNFRVYFIGLLISVLGLWAQTIAQNWLIYDLTDSALTLGKVNFLLAVPVLFLSPWAGVILDRYSRRSVLIFTQTLMMVQAFALAYLDFSGKIVIWAIMILSFVRGIANSFDAPGRQSIIVELVGKDDLANGIALNSTMFSLARTIGPAVGGLIIAAWGTAWGFTINGITFLAILISLTMLRIPKASAVAGDHTPLQDLKEGWHYIRGERKIVGLFTLIFAMALFGNFTTILPFYTVKILGKTEVEYGLLNGANGFGALAGTLFVAYLSTRKGRGRQLMIINFLMPILLALLAFTKTYISSLVVIFFLGIVFIPQLSLSNMLLQEGLPDQMRGRVMSIYTLLVHGGFPLGSLIAGATTELFGPSTALLFSALAIFVISVVVRLTIPEVGQLE